MLWWLVVSYVRWQTRKNRWNTFNQSLSFLRKKNLTTPKTNKWICISNTTKPRLVKFLETISIEDDSRKQITEFCNNCKRTGVTSFLILPQTHAFIFPDFPRFFVNELNSFTCKKEITIAFVSILCSTFPRCSVREAQTNTKLILYQVSTLELKIDCWMLSTIYDLSDWSCTAMK